MDPVHTLAEQIDQPGHEVGEAVIGGISDYRMHGPLTLCLRRVDWHAIEAAYRRTRQALGM